MESGPSGRPPIDEATRARAELAGLDAAVRGIAGVLDLERVLQLIVDRVRELAPAQYAALGIMGADGMLEEFITSGISQERRRRIGPLPHGHGLLGLIVRENRSFRIRDIATDPRRYGFPTHHPPMHSFLGVPVRIRGRSIGNFYLTNKRGADQFSEHDQRLVEMFALHAAIAIDNARLHESVQRLAVMEERERIGRDLHDGIIQRIYAATLRLDEASELLEGDSAGAQERLETAIEALHGTIRDIRNFIFGLRPVLLEEGGLIAALGSLAAEASRNSTVEVTVDLVGAVPELPLAVTAELVALVREALTNVVRHAEASHARVGLQATAGRLRLRVVDDGRGFDPRAPRRSIHQGLPNLRARAAVLGGRLTIKSSPGHGARIMVSIPLKPHLTREG
jgi:signal transduction histidine kinase